MNRAEVEEWARGWIRDWCERDIERIVSHFAEDARFVSPFAAERTGSAVVVGHEALRAYWQAAHSFGSFRFNLDRVIWDESSQAMVILYTRDIDGRRDRASEILRFNENGKVVEGEAMYGAEGI